MANLPITGLPALSTLVNYSADSLPIVDGGITKKFVANQLGLGGQSQTFSNQTTDLTLTNPIPTYIIAEMNGTGLSIILPVFDASSSTRYGFTITNTGAQSCLLKTSDGTSIQTIGPGETVFCYPKSNATDNPSISILKLGTLASQDANNVNISGGTITFTQLAGCDFTGGTIGTEVTGTLIGRGYNTSTLAYVNFLTVTAASPTTWAFSQPSGGTLSWTGGSVNSIPTLTYTNISTTTTQLANIGLNAQAVVQGGVSADVTLTNPLAEWRQIEMTTINHKVFLPDFSQANASCRTFMLENTGTASFDVYLNNTTTLIDTLSPGYVMMFCARDTTSSPPYVYRILSPIGSNPMKTVFVGSTPVSMAANTAYGAMRTSGTQQFSLPTTALPGDIIRLTGASSGVSTIWQITQVSNQYVWVNDTQTTIGSGGSITSAGFKDSITLMCIELNKGYVMIGSSGTFTIV